MDLYYKMPLDLARAAKFFKKIGNSILKEYYDIIGMAKKNKFAFRAIETFKEQAAINELDSMVFFDGVENFSRGMPLFSLCAISENKILIYDPILSLCFWGDVKDFYVDFTKVSNNFNLNPKFADEQVYIEKNTYIPNSLKIAWFLTGSIAGFYCDDERFFPVIETITNQENLYTR